MKQIYLIPIITIFILSMPKVNAQTEWTGPMTTFTKANFADWTLEANQDRINNNVWITRANIQSIFNIADTNDTTAGDCDGDSPLDTEWAFGTIADGVGTLTFDTFLGSDFANCTPPTVVNQDAVLHLITDDIYIDIKFTSWSSGGTGGGISYQRSTDQSLSTNELVLDKKVKLFPNPTSNFLEVTGLTKNESYRIYSILGVKVKNGNISDNQRINIQNLTSGLYFLKFENGNTIKFLKE